MFSECFKGILGACRGESAARLLQWRDADLIESYQKDEWSDCYFFKRLFH